MTNKITSERNKSLGELFKGTSLEDHQYQDFETSEELIESMQEEINEEEVIYYSHAMEYLSEYDHSLKESIALAVDLGYELKNVNSELLATLLQQQNLMEELNGLMSKIKEVYTESEANND